MSHRVERISEPLVLGEGPHWDERARALYLVDIMGKTIQKYVPETGEHTISAPLEGRVGFIVPLESHADQFVIGLERRFVVVQWDGAAGSTAAVVRELGEVDQGKKTRINDGKCDPRGRLYAGTMGHEEVLGQVEKEQGSLFRLDGAKLTTLVERVGISNGLAWHLGRNAFYYTDSLDDNIRKYDYDVASGEITNKSFIFDFKKNKIEGVPDGTTIDTDGNLWVAVFGGSCVLKIDPTTGKLLQKIPIPAKQVTSVTFGGDKYDILFVTSASLPIGGEEQPPPCGATFMVTGLGVKGLPNINFKL